MKQLIFVFITYLCQESVSGRVRQEKRSEKDKGENMKEKRRTKSSRRMKERKEEVSCARLVSKCHFFTALHCHLSFPSFSLCHFTPPPKNVHLFLFSQLFPSPRLSFHLPLSFSSCFSFSCIPSLRTSPELLQWLHTLVHTNGKQIVGPVKWNKIDYLYLVTEHTHACACSEGGGGCMLSRCIEPSQGKLK